MSESPDRLQPESPRTPRASNSKSGDWSPRTQTLPSHVLQERSRLRVSNGCCCPGCLSTQAGAVSPWASGQLSTPNKQLHLQPGQAHDTLEPPSQASSVRIWVHGPERTGHQAPPAHLCCGLEDLPGVQGTDASLGTSPPGHSLLTLIIPTCSLKSPQTPTLILDASIQCFFCL